MTEIPSYEKVSHFTELKQWRKWKDYRVWEQKHWRNPAKPQKVEMERSDVQFRVKAAGTVQPSDLIHLEVVVLTCHRTSKYLYSLSYTKLSFNILMFNRARDFLFHDSGGIGIVSWELHKIFLISFWARFVTLQFFHNTTIWCLLKCTSSFLFILSPFSVPFLSLFSICFELVLE